MTHGGGSEVPSLAVDMTLHANSFAAQPFGPRNPLQLLDYFWTQQRTLEWLGMPSHFRGELRVSVVPLFLDKARQLDLRRREEREAGRSFAGKPTTLMHQVCVESSCARSKGKHFLFGHTNKKYVLVLPVSLTPC
jgi:hypothetical protein